MALSRDEVVRTAVRLLDEVGLEGLTLRRLARELGVTAPTLYWHVQHKRELLDLMVESIMAEATTRSGSPAPGQPWWDWLAEQSRLQWQALLSHRDAALVAAGNRPTESGVSLVEETIGSLVAVGFPPREALWAILTLGHYVIGCAVEYQAEAARAQLAGNDRALHERLGEADLPNLAAAVSLHGGPDPGGGFEHGLALLMTGLRVRHASLTEAGAQVLSPA